MPLPRPRPFPILRKILPHTSSSKFLLQDASSTKFGPEILDQIVESTWRGSIRYVESINMRLVYPRLHGVRHRLWTSDRPGMSTGYGQLLEYVLLSPLDALSSGYRGCPS